ncbi:hypothetical protein F5144DRAFT_182701 [Chaetomium tenue]|uniref:Uncharacterized protein n=1 Tax=Chaetomium tenue TaxID=1854479 RepID=A0ACB7PHK4_9PEZI|nr:hypothetical protein F5144DRAFT_182701 [Chaetomium globosum]
MEVSKLTNELGLHWESTFLCLLLFLPLPLPSSAVCFWPRETTKSSPSLQAQHHSSKNRTHDRPRFRNPPWSGRNLYCVVPGALVGLTWKTHADALARYHQVGQVSRQFLPLGSDNS